MPRVNMLKFCDAVAKDYAKERMDEGGYEDFGYKEETRLVKKYVKRKDNILDLCCGPGTFIIPLHKKNYRIEGLDYSKGMLNEARRRQKGLKLIHADASKIPRQNEIYDTVLYLGNSLGSIPSKNIRQKTLNEAYRVLKKDGKLILTVNNRRTLGKHLPSNLLKSVKYKLGLEKDELGKIYFDMGTEKGMIYLYTYPEVKTELRKAGFTKIKRETQIGKYYIILTARK